MKLALLLGLFATGLYAQTADYIEVTATKIEEDVLQVPGTLTIITHEDLQRTGARDLSTALALAGGVSIAPGGDAGPAGSVPEIWGLREADAFLLIIDGVPSGGAFMPQTEAIDLENVERIEVLRGSAPVVYGATAFSGVIHVIHRRDTRAGEVHAGSYGSAGVSAQIGGWNTGIDHERYRADRTGFDRGRLGWRGEKQTGRGVWRFDTDALRLQQDPASPWPRGSNVGIDENFNPADARINETRLHGVGSFTTPAFGGSWTTMLALTHSNIDTLRGFVEDPDARTGTGFSQSRRMVDVYFDSHVVSTPLRNVQLLSGLDFLGGNANAESATFDYSIDRLNALQTTEEGIDLHDRRNFAAAYIQSEWTPSAAWHIDTGLRLNHTQERKGESSDTNTRASGFAGVNRLLGAKTWLFADYRNTFKPAVVDFGPDDEDQILRPETSASYEIGVKRRDGRMFWQASLFTMDLKNLVVAQEQDGQPSLANGGRQRFRGAEIESALVVSQHVRLRASYSRHDARFRDYVQEFDGVPAQLSGKRVEMSARDLASAGATFSAGRWNGAVAANFVGSRYLNKRNTALASAYTMVDAGVGHRTTWGELRVDGQNLTNRRDPVAESELGDAQYYRMPARSLRLTFRRPF